MVHNFDLLEGLRMKYRSKPVDVEAVRFRVGMLESELRPFRPQRPCTLEVQSGDWIIKDGDTFSVCSDEEFKRKYEEIEK